MNEVLVKYYGLVSDKGNEELIPRSEFLKNGFFRITQPKFLSDKGSEGKFYPYFNHFSQVDLKWAKSEYDKFQINPDYEVSDDELIRFLRPMGVRVGQSFPYLLKQQTGYDTIEEFDEAQFDKIVGNLNKYLTEALSTQLGVLSLCKSDKNKLMWDRYASEGKGLAISFKESHPFFNQFVPKAVSYKKEERASFTYFEGNCRVNGVPVEDFYIHDLLETSNGVADIFTKDIDFEELTRRLIFAKSEEWRHEEEIRIVCPLTLCEENKGKEIHSKLDLKSAENKGFFLQSYSEIYLKKIPFDAFESIILGFDMESESQKLIIQLLKANPELSHVKLKVAKHTIFGNIEVVDI